MEEELKKKFKKYVYPGKFLTILTILFAILSIVTSIYWFYLFSNARSYLVFYNLCVYLLTVVVVFVIVTAICIFVQWKVIKKVNEIEQRGELPLVLHDFEVAGTAFKDSLKLGQMYMFGKENGGIFAYNDVIQIYQYIHKTNGLEDSRMIKVKTSDGKIHYLCRLPLRGKGDDELRQVFAYIKSKNEKIYLGYH